MKCIRRARADEDATAKQPCSVGGTADVCGQARIIGLDVKYKFTRTGEADHMARISRGNIDEGNDPPTRRNLVEVAFDRSGKDA